MRIYKERLYGEEQPYMLGSFLQVRLPFIHMKFEWPEFVQGLFLCVLPMSGAAVWGETFGVPFQAAVLMLCINNFIFLVHPMFGCPAVAGWITAGLPLYIMFCSTYPMEERIHALIALQLDLGVIFLVLHVTRVAKAFMDRVPMFIKCGILMGAAFTAIISEVEQGGRFWSMPIAMSIALVLAFFVMFSLTSERLKAHHKVYRFIAKFGIAIPFIIGLIVGTAIGEIKAPDIQWYFGPSSFKEIGELTSVLSIGFPPMSMFIAAFPTAISAYIIGYGDMMVIDSLIEKADEVRKDEKIRFSVTRVGFICGLRNIFQGIFVPHIGMCGPMVGGPQAMVINRYMNSSREEMDSYWGGCWSICLGMSSALLVGPFVSLLQNGAAIGMTLNLVIQGFLCGYLAINLLNEHNQSDGQKGMAVVVGAFIAALGAAWGLAAGIVLWFVVDKDWFRSKFKLSHESAHEESKEEKVQEHGKEE